MLPKRKGGQSSRDLLSFLFAHTFYPYSTNVSYIGHFFFFPSNLTLIEERLNKAIQENNLEKKNKASYN